MCLLTISFCQSLDAQFFNGNQGWNNRNFNRGSWGNGMQNFNRGSLGNGMQNFNRGSWGNGMQNFNRGSWGNNNFNRQQFYPSSPGMNRTPVRHYGRNNSQQGRQEGQGQGQGQQQNNNSSALSMNNGYQQGRMQTQSGGYYRVDTKRNIWTFVPRPSSQNGVK